MRREAHSKSQLSYICMMRRLSHLYKSNTRTDAEMRSKLAAL